MKIILKAPYINEPISALRALNYPVTSRYCFAVINTMAGAHTDYGSLTILLPNTDETRGNFKSKILMVQWIDIPMILMSLLLILVI